jgi:hypothetical protein
LKNWTTLARAVFVLKGCEGHVEHASHLFRRGAAPGAEPAESETSQTFGFSGVPAPDPDSPEMERLSIPRDMHDRSAWDEHWWSHQEYRLMEATFGDIMASDEHFSGRTRPARCTQHPLRRQRPLLGGSIAGVIGDLIDPAVCPGPFDVVIERRTVQLFRDDEEKHAAMDRLAARLGDRGLLVGHQHSGGRKSRERISRQPGPPVTVSSITTRLRPSQRLESPTCGSRPAD